MGLARRLRGVHSGRTDLPHRNQPTLGYRFSAGETNGALLRTDLRHASVKVSGADHGCPPRALPAVHSDERQARLLLCLPAPLENWLSAIPPIVHRAHGSPSGSRGRPRASSMSRQECASRRRSRVRQLACAAKFPAAFPTRSGQASVDRQRLLGDPVPTVLVRDEAVLARTQFSAVDEAPEFVAQRIDVVRPKETCLVTISR